MTNDDARRAASLDTVRRCVDVAAGLGVDTILLTLGSLPADLYYNEAYANALQSMHRLAPHAEARGVSLAIEYVWNWFLLSPMEFARFCDECASPRIGFYFDPGNMTIFGHAEHWARICGPYIQKVHMKDFRRNGAQWPPLLEGDVNFPAVMSELRKAGYAGPLISEVGPDTATLAETAQAIRQIMAM
jgi:hexulose-6-phosphate isomerase